MRVKCGLDSDRVGGQKREFLSQKMLRGNLGWAKSKPLWPRANQKWSLCRACSASDQSQARIFESEWNSGWAHRIPKSDPSTWLFYKYMYRVGLFGYQGSGLVFNPHEIQVGFRFWTPESDPSSRLFEPAQNFATQGRQLDTPHWFTYWLCVCQSLDT